MSYLGQKYDRGIVVQRSEDGSAYQEVVDVDIDSPETSLENNLPGGIKKVNISAVGGSEVEANPELEGDEDALTGIEIDGTKYKVDGGTEVEANPTLVGTEANLTGLQVGDTKYKVGGGSSSESSFDGFNFMELYSSEESYPTTPSDYEDILSTITYTQAPTMLQVVNFWIYNPSGNTTTVEVPILDGLGENYSFKVPCGEKFFFQMAIINGSSSEYVEYRGWINHQYYIYSKEYEEESYEQEEETYYRLVPKTDWTVVDRAELPELPLATIDKKEDKYLFIHYVNDNDNWIQQSTAELRDVE